MPKYYGAGVEARLAVCSLQASTNSTFVPREQYVREIERVQDAMDQGHILKEEPIPCWDGEPGRVHFIGDDEVFPFMLVKVGAPRKGASLDQSDADNSGNSSDSGYNSTSAARSGGDVTSPDKAGPMPPPPTPYSNRNNTSLTPRALFLTVEFSPHSFNRDFGPGRDYHANVDVYVNGVFCGFQYLTRRNRHNTARDAAQFSGYRCHHHLELPFIIHPASNQLGAVLGYNPPDDQSVWMATSAALAQSAERPSVHESGQSRPSARYLKSLASMPMPADMTSGDASTGLGPAIVDIVVTLGEGKKCVVRGGYIKEPVPLVNSGVVLGSSFTRRRRNVKDLPRNDDSQSPAVTDTLEDAEAYFQSQIPLLLATGAGLSPNGSLAKQIRNQSDQPDSFWSSSSTHQHASHLEGPGAHKEHKANNVDMQDISNRMRNTDVASINDANPHFTRLAAKQPPSTVPKKGSVDHGPEDRSSRRLSMETPPYRGGISNSASGMSTFSTEPPTEFDTPSTIPLTEKSKTVRFVNTPTQSHRFAPYPRSPLALSTPEARTPSSAKGRTPRNDAVAQPPAVLTDPRCVVTVGDVKEKPLLLQHDFSAASVTGTKNVHDRQWVRHVRAELGGEFAEQQVLVGMRFVVPGGAGF